MKVSSLLLLFALFTLKSEASAPANIVVDIPSEMTELCTTVRVNHATHTFTDDEGNSNIIFFVNIRDTPGFCEWVTQKKGDAKNVSFHCIRNQKALVLIKETWDRNDRLMWNTLATIKKDDENYKIP